MEKTVKSSKKEHKLKRYTFYYLDGSKICNTDLFAKSEPGAYNELYEYAGSHVKPLKMYMWQKYPEIVDVSVMDGES